jgi:branched-chain amino acid transport system permease protein
MQGHWLTITGSLTDKQKKLLSIGIVCLIIAIPHLGLSPFIMRMLTLSGIYVVLGLSLNLLAGIAGQVSMGHAAFYGIGAYTSALLSLRFGVPFSITCIAAGIVAALTGLLLCFPAMKLKGTYFTFVTLGFCEIVRLVALNWIGLTRGPMGLPGIPPPAFFGWVIETDAGYFYLIAAIAGIAYVVVNNIANSRTGRAFIAIREDTLVAEAMGIDVFKYKMIAFATSSFFAGLVGAFFAHYVTFIDPASFTFDESSLILSLVVLGGMGNFKGTILAALILIAIPEVMRGLQTYRMLIYGLTLVVMMIVRPQGILGAPTRMRVIIDSNAHKMGGGRNASTAASK